MSENNKWNSFPPFDLSVSFDLFPGGLYHPENAAQGDDFSILRNMTHKEILHKEAPNKDLIHLYKAGLLFLLLLLASCCHKQPQQEKVSQPYTSYWDGFDFSDQSFVDNNGVTEPKFADFCKLLATQTDTDRKRQVDTLLHRSLNGSIEMYQNMMELAEKYLADPNSPYRDEETYILFLQHTINEPHLTEAYKERPRFQLAQAMKNRAGTKASDISYITRDNKNGTLYNIKSTYTLLYFNNPECHDCRRVSYCIKNSPIIKKLLSTKAITILAIYPDHELRSWNEHKEEYPSSWTVGRYAPNQDREAYNLPAIPNLYLLDRNKNVILKDAPIEKIETHLASEPNI